MNLNSTELPWVTNFMILLFYKTDLNSYILHEGQVYVKKVVFNKTEKFKILNKKPIQVYILSLNLRFVNKKSFLLL